MASYKCKVRNSFTTGHQIVPFQRFGVAIRCGMPFRFQVESVSGCHSTASPRSAWERLTRLLPKDTNVLCTWWLAWFRQHLHADSFFWVCEGNCSFQAAVYQTIRKSWFHAYWDKYLLGMGKSARHLAPPELATESCNTGVVRCILHETQNAIYMPFLSFNSVAVTMVRIFSHV